MIFLLLVWFQSCSTELLLLDSGHSYNINDETEMKKITQDDHETIVKFLNLLQKHLESNSMEFDIASLDISVGSTPSMFAHENLDIPNKVELHPGNYVFYDRQQLYTGACADEDSIAGLVLTRVIGHYRDAERNAIMVDAGATQNKNNQHAAAG